VLGSMSFRVLRAFSSSVSSVQAEGATHFPPPKLFLMQRHLLSCCAYVSPAYPPSLLTYCFWPETSCVNFAVRDRTTLFFFCRSDTFSFLRLFLFWRKAVLNPSEHSPPLMRLLGREIDFAGPAAEFSCLLFWYCVLFFETRVP